jgi:drug/metabolite transporter (DMT)-like permease
MGALALNLIRLVMALGIFMALGLVRSQTPLPMGVGAHGWLWLSISGLVGFTLGDLCLFHAFVRIGARLSMLVMALVPVLTTLGGFLLGEALGPWAWIGMLVVMAGVGWVILERQPTADGGRTRLDLPGLALGLGGAAGQAAGLLLSKYGMGQGDPFVSTQIRVLAGIGGFVVLFTLLGLWPRVRLAMGNRPALARAGLGSVFGPFLGVSLSLLAVKHAQAGVAATLMALVPVTIIPLAILVKKERVSARAVIGAGIAVAGAAILFL